MSGAEGLLIFGMVSLACTLAALVRIKHLWWFMPLYFFVAWLAGELALFNVAVQGVIVALLLIGGGLASAAGVLGFLLCLLSWAGLYYFHQQGRASFAVHECALADALGTDYRKRVLAAGRVPLRETATREDWIRPFSMRLPGVDVITDVAYGDAGVRNQLDIYRPVDHGESLPVLLQIHGGAWMIGAKEQQALPLMNHLAGRGWLCVAANYRLSPRVKFPQHLIDVKRALAWVRENIAKYGGDPDFVVVTGGSAGGHLSSLLALTANRPELQPGFEQVDTSVAACVPFYGVYDFLDRHGERGVSSMTRFLEGRVMPVAPAEDPALWELASPITSVHREAPPFFVLAGTHDSMVFVEDARHFVQALRETSMQPVAYSELPLAQHAFDIFHSPRADNTVFAVARFVETQYADYVSGAGQGDGVNGVDVS